MPYCPSCRSEYEEGTVTCADCGEPLVDQLDDNGSVEELVDVYECWEGQQAERLATVLRDSDIHVLVRDRSSSAFPTNVGKTAQQLLAVPREQAADARSVISNAVNDGVVPAEGNLLTES
jgi:hypothetical protein